MQFVLKRKVIARRASAVPWNAGQAKVNSLCEIPREFTSCDCNIIIALRTEKNQVGHRKSRMSKNHSSE